MKLALQSFHAKIHSFLNLEKNPHTYGQLIFDKGNKNIKWRKKKISLTSSAEKTGQQHVKE